MNVSSDRRTVGLSERQTTPRRGRRGTVLMEAVLCLPVLLFLVTGIVQFTRIWEARLLTRHAAYNAARTAIVYNPSDYAVERNGSIRFHSASGAVWAAAVNTLVWKSGTYSAGGTAPNFRFPGFPELKDERGIHGLVPNSALIREQVRIVSSESWESNGLVRVTVEFKFPLLFSLFALGSVQGDPDADDALGATLVHDGTADIAPRDRWSDDTPHIRLRETCLLPKPWSTARYPRVSPDEAAFLEMSP